MTPDEIIRLRARLSFWAHRNEYRFLALQDRLRHEFTFWSWGGRARLGYYRAQLRLMRTAAETAGLCTLVRIQADRLADIQ